MKIGFVLDDGLDKPDGVQQNILTLGKWLKSKGHEVTYLVGETGRADIENVVVLSKNLRVSFNGNRLSIPLYSSIGKINSSIRNRKFDIIHVQVPYSPFMAARLIKRLDKTTAVVGTFHILPTGFATSKGTKLLGKMLFKNLKRFDRQLAVSEPARLFALQSFGISCEVLPNPVDVSKYRTTNLSRNNDQTIKLFFLGRLVSRKGCAEFLKATNYMLKNHLAKNRFHIDICGDGPERSKLEDYVSKNNLNEYIKFHGFVSENQKIKFMQRANISVFPSLGGESFGIVLAEAMAAGGGVVLGGDNPGYKSVFGNLRESLFNPVDTKEFAEKLARYINFKKNREALFIKQQLLVQQFDVARLGEKLLNIYKDCISLKKSR